MNRQRDNAVDGTRIHRVIGLESDRVTRTQAEEFIEQARTEARERRLSLPKGRKLHVTFATAADTYLVKLKEIGGKDYTANEQHIRLHLKPFFGSMRWDAIAEFNVLKFRAHLRQKELSEATINRTLATFRRMGRRLVQWRVVQQPLPNVKLSAEGNRRTWVLSDDEEKSLLAAALKDSQAYIWLFIRIGLATSLRHAEILSARFENFDQGRRRLKVKVKGGRWREQPLTQGIADVIAKEQSMATDQAGWLFPHKRSKTGHIEQMSEAFARCVKAAGMDPAVVVPHTMRHTAITRFSATGADIKTIQEFSGHTSLAMVMHYVHARDRTVDAALAKMEGGTVVELPKPSQAKNS